MIHTVTAGASPECSQHAGPTYTTAESDVDAELRLSVGLRCRIGEFRRMVQYRSYVLVARDSDVSMVITTNLPLSQAGSHRGVVGLSRENTSTT